MEDKGEMAHLLEVVVVLLVVRHGCGSCEAA